RLLVFDTCASGGAIQISRQGTNAFAFRSAFEQLGQQGGVFTLAASGATQEAHEVDDLKHGLLTYALLSGANAADFGPLSDRHAEAASVESLDVLEWFGFAAGNVPRLTKQYFGSEQQVHLSGTGTTFPVLSIR
ncbi:MAG: hypothetical protein KDB01_22025, partial [Planctomycetaceae bacterium]|nr:hypothetical protein [Planctomycetaceae bacterium]